MSQQFVPAVFYRGGTSKGVFFNAKVLPQDRDTVSKMLVAAAVEDRGNELLAHAVLAIGSSAPMYSRQTKGRMPPWRQ